MRFAVPDRACDQLDPLVEPNPAGRRSPFSRHLLVVPQRKHRELSGIHFKSQGSLIGVKRAGDHASHRNQSSFQVYAGGLNRRYCYVSKRRNVSLVTRGNTYTFSTDGNSFFEFASGSPDDMIGRFWTNSANRGGTPDAVCRGN